MVTAYVYMHLYVYIYIYKKRERHTNSSMLVSSEASILRNQRFSIIINPRCARLLEEKIKGEGEKYKKKEIIKKKENEKSNGKCDHCAHM